MPELPIVDMSALHRSEDVAGHARVAREIRSACREHGFFYVVGHGIAPSTLDALERSSRRFFSLPQSEKEALAMKHGGRAWRGYFPLGGELTSGRPDRKQGLYFGTELPAEHPRVRAGTPLHGPNLWPDALPELKPRVLAYMEAATAAAQTLLEGVAQSLDLERDYFRRTYTANPTVLFRIFHYPPCDAESWSVGEHTDYGLLTLLAQDRVGGLQVRSGSGWIEAPPIPGALVCNLGDMLDRLTGGWYRSTPHRVRNASRAERLSFPLFLDPDFEATMEALPTAARRGEIADAPARWDAADLHAFEGRYGDYLIGKVSKVFPELASGRIQS